MVLGGPSTVCKHPIPWLLCPAETRPGACSGAGGSSLSVFLQHRGMPRMSAFQDGSSFSPPPTGKNQTIQTQQRTVSASCHAVFSHAGQAPKACVCVCSGVP